MLKCNMISKFEFRFKNINSVGEKTPTCNISLNGKSMYEGQVNKLITCEGETSLENVLKIFFTNKSGRDTLLNKDGTIKQDLNFELVTLHVDSVDFEHLIWESRYVAVDDVFDSCLFFGPKGHWEIRFSHPVLKWFLKTNQEKNNNDPNWETDYNYYKEACQRLSKTQTR